MLLEGESAEGNTILFFFSFLFHPALRFPLDLENRSLRVPVPNTLTFIYFFFFYDFEDLEIFSPSSPSPSPFFLAKERNERWTSGNVANVSKAADERLAREGGRCT